MEVVRILPQVNLAIISHVRHGELSSLSCGWIGIQHAALAITFQRPLPQYVCAVLCPLQGVLPASDARLVWRLPFNVHALFEVVACCRGILLAASNQYGGYFRSLFGPSSFGWAFRTIWSDRGILKHCCRGHCGCESIILPAIDRHFRPDLASLEWFLVVQRMGGEASMELRSSQQR